MRRRIFIKQMTPAEAGDTKTHEKYVRLPNNFDYQAFFQQEGITNGSVIQVDFDAAYNGDQNDIIPLKFVYYASSNQEKRIPSLGPIFDKYNVTSSDVVYLESRTENGRTSFSISFKKDSELRIFTSPIVYEIEDVEDDIQKQAITLNDSITNQIIYYGAPGTGKSHTVKKQSEGESVVRTTFHPDSDYSTFVGCYKPTTKKVAMRDVTGKIIVENDGTQVTEDRIVYEFVDQAFLQAYIKAWKFYAEAAEGAEPKKQYLIIEEINRGNCAQIFGDLFQLLDRNGYGFSDYYIHADKDMQKHLSKAFNNIDIDESHRNAINSLYPKDGDVVAKVLSGEILLLPDNLYIWATMNTSDQSLFPIDSAFKRRWDWRFRPIVKGRDNSGKELDWKIKVGQKVCAWWNFLEKINVVIGTMTSSADKKLGFFFCKAENGIISAETFVSKVIFYLWNDVFKDYGFEGSIFSDSEGTLDFDKFYGIDVDGEVVVQNDKIELFLTNLGLTLVDVDSVNENINNEGEVAENDGTSFEVVLDGERISEKTAIGKFLKVIEKVGIEKVAQLGLQVSGNPIISRDKLAEDTPGGYGGSQKYINGYWFVTKFNNPTKRKFLMEIKEKLGVNIVVE